MTTKEMVIKSIEELPEDATWEDIQERINFVAGVRSGLRELDEGMGLPHEKIRSEAKYSLCELLDGITKENLHDEIETGEPRGAEIW